jgi:hypothetical protein
MSIIEFHPPIKKGGKGQLLHPYVPQSVQTKIVHNHAPDPQEAEQPAPILRKRPVLQGSRGLGPIVQPRGRKK